MNRPFLIRKNKFFISLVLGGQGVEPSSIQFFFFLLFDIPTLIEFFLVFRSKMTGCMILKMFIIFSCV